MYTTIKAALALIIPTVQAQTLLQPLSSSCGNVFSRTGPLEVLLGYFACSTGFIYDIAVGFCVLWVLVGGIQIIISGDNTEWYNRGKSIIFASIGGLLVLILAPVILRFLNSAFYT